MLNVLNLFCYVIFSIIKKQIYIYCYNNIFCKHMPNNVYLYITYCLAIIYSVDDK